MGRGAHRRSSVTWALAVAAGFSVLAAMGGAAATGAEGGQAVPRFARIDASLLESSGANPAFVPASLSDTPVSVVLEMAGAAVAVVDAGAQVRGQGLSESDKHAIRQELKAQQDALQDGLAGAGASVVGQMQDAYNGIQVIVPQTNLTQLAGLPGVIAVHATQVFTPSNVNGVPYVGAPTAWGSFSVTGAGVKIAVIDTGIDYTHADFGGPGTVPAWTAAKAAGPASADRSLFGPAAAKVKGGFDFVGDAYNANIAGSKPMPDTNPLDCNGHGSHTAGTAAGFGVLSDGSTFHGPYNATTISSHTWNVGPGVAPGADIYAYRVFGCTGSSNIVALTKPSATSVPAIDANGATLPIGTFPVKVLKNADGSIALGCHLADYAGTAGSVVVTARGSCARVARAVFGDETGDAAVVMVNNTASLPPFEGKITSNPDTNEHHTVTIPFLGVGSGDGAALLAAEGGSVTLADITVPNTGYKKAASFTAGGPRNPDSAPKPDVMAPGVSVASAGMGTGSQAAVISGTSMACPMTAGRDPRVTHQPPRSDTPPLNAPPLHTPHP